MKRFLYLVFILLISTRVNAAYDCQKTEIDSLVSGSILNANIPVGYQAKFCRFTKIICENNYFGYNFQYYVFYIEDPDNANNRMRVYQYRDAYGLNGVTPSYSLKSVDSLKLQDLSYEAYYSGPVTKDMCTKLGYKY